MTCSLKFDISNTGQRLNYSGVRRTTENSKVNTPVFKHKSGLIHWQRLKLVRYLEIEMIRCVIGFLRADKINLPESEYTGNQIDFDSTFCQFLDFISIIIRLMFHSHPGILFKKSLES